MTEEDRLAMFAARGFDRFKVRLCPTESGKEFAKAMEKRGL